MHEVQAGPLYPSGTIVFVSLTAGFMHDRLPIGRFHHSGHARSDAVRKMWP